MNWLFIIIFCLFLILSLVGGNDQLVKSSEVSEPFGKLFSNESEKTSSQNPVNQPRPPTSKKRRANKEIEALHHAKRLKDRLRNVYLGSHRKLLLMGVFMNATSLIARDTLYLNLQKLSYLADFAIIIYDGDEKAISSVCNVNDTSILDKIVHCRRAAISYSPGHRVIPKPLLYPELIDYLPNYKKTILMDEDISLQEFNISEFLSIWECAFYPLPPPLIAQGLVNVNTQFYPFVHYDTWHLSSNVSSVIATATDLVEQQMPAFDSLFLLWFIQHVMVYTRSESLRLETDWGPDGFWCGSVRAFAHHVYEVKKPSEMIPCIIVVGTKPFHHLNTRSLNTKKTKFGKYVIAGLKASASWKKFFPLWKTNWEDPSFLETSYQYSYGIRRECPYLQFGPIR